jgi:hypothetical protein
MDAGTITFYKNNVSQGTAFSGLSGTLFPSVGTSNVSTCSFTINFGQRAFAYPLSGFKALCDTNLGAPVVAKPNTLMDVALYTGNGGTQTISGLAFEPDFVWLKGRSVAYSHQLYDQVRGAGKLLNSNLTSGESTVTDNLTAFTSAGFTLGNDAGTNQSSATYVAWAWDAGTSTVSNTDGSITSQVRANVSAGFSVVTYTGNGTGGATFGHGLGVKPGFSICKKRTGSPDGWYILHSSLGATKYVALNSTNAATTYSGLWNDTEPTSTLFSLGVDFGSNQSGVDYVSYQFAPVVGYSSMGSYVASSGLPYVYLGFRPRFVLIKNITSSSTGWRIIDSARDSFNDGAGAYWLSAQSSGAEVDERPVDLLSNGFKLRMTDGGDLNYSSDTYIYYAVAENPFQYARAR